MTTEENIQQTPPYRIAFIIDGEVADILHTDERLAAIFTSNPQIMDITGISAVDTTGILPGATYNSEDNTFTNPEYDTPTQNQIEEAQRTLVAAKAAGLI